MHVAIVCRGLGGAGSVAAVALRQARELARSMRVTLVSDSFPPQESLACATVPVPQLGFLRRFRHVPDEWAFARAARHILQTLDPDFTLCHAHATAWLAARGRTHGLFVHGDISDRPAGMYDRRLTAFYEYVTPRAYRNADVVFAPARHFAELARTRGAKRAEWLPHGIDPAEIGAVDTSPSPRASDRMRILFVGRLSVEKGIRPLLDATDALQAKHELTLVGSGPLESLVRSRLNPHTHLLAPRPRATLGALYRAHDVFCLPAWSETFGLVIAEALVCGLPVVATNVGGIPDLITHGVNGLLVPPNDAGALAEALDLLASDEAFRMRLAANARASVLPRLEWRAIGERLGGVIRTMRA